MLFKQLAFVSLAHPYIFSEHNVASHMFSGLARLSNACAVPITFFSLAHTHTRPTRLESALFRPFVRPFQLAATEHQSHIDFSDSRARHFQSFMGKPMKVVGSSGVWFV